MPPEAWALLVYSAAVLLIVAAMIGLSHVLGQRHREPGTADPYESGIVTTGSARVPLNARFYLVAMLFVIFDIEAVLLFAWAVSFRDLGWSGYGGALFFIVILTVGLVYEWRMGALDFGPEPRRQPSAKRKSERSVRLRQGFVETAPKPGGRRRERAEEAREP